MVGKASWDTSIVLKPAVRGVTDPKKAVTNLGYPDKPERVCCSSNIQ